MLRNYLRNKKGYYELLGKEKRKNQIALCYCILSLYIMRLLFTSTHLRKMYWN